MQEVIQEILFYLGPGPAISGQLLCVQYSETVPYIRFTCSKNPIAKINKNMIRIDIYDKN